MKPQDPGGFFRLLETKLAVAVRSGFPIGQVANHHLGSPFFQGEKGSPHGDLDIIGMGPEGQNIHSSPPGRSSAGSDRLKSYDGIRLFPGHDAENPLIEFRKRVLRNRR